MRFLIACEESQAVTIELRKLGHEAYSCDLMDCSGGAPGMACGRKCASSAERRL